MIQAHRILLLFLLNSLWQIPLLYMAAFLSTRFLRRSSFVLQHRVWVSTLFLCIGLPLVDAIGWVRALVEHTFLHTRQVSKSISDSILMSVDRTGPSTSAAHSSFGTLNLANVLLVLWAGWIVFRLLQITWAYRRISAIVRLAKSPEITLGMEVISERQKSLNGTAAFDVLLSDEVAMPATTGIRAPVVLLPCAIAQAASKADLDALLAHEYAHIARNDFRHNLICEVLATPLSYHPAMRGLLARISDTRELICDRMAAERTGDALGYAESLVRLSGLLLQPITSTTPALGLFEGQKLENRVMSLLDSTPRSTNKWTAMMGLLSLSIFAPCCVTAAGYTFQPAALVATDLQPYAGTWHWMFKGKPFLTMQLVPAGDHFTGYMTDGFFNADSSGNMTDAGSQPGRSPIIRSFFSGKTLHIVVQDDHDKSLSEWTMNLLDSKKAEFNTADPGAPKNMKSWTAERVSE